MINIYIRSGRGYREQVLEVKKALAGRQALGILCLHPYLTLPYQSMQVGEALKVGLRPCQVGVFRSISEWRKSVSTTHHHHMDMDES